MTTLEITAIGAAGDGIARAEGGAVFLPWTLPGETVDARLQGRRGEALAWLQESPDRVPPSCPHFGTCGGCALQHWAPAPYAAWKAGLLRDALRSAGFPDAPVAPLVPGTPGTRRRLELGFGGGRLGLARAGATDLVDLRTCHVAEPALVALLAPLRALLPRLSLARGGGDIALNRFDSGPDLLFRTGTAPAPRDRMTLAEFATTHGIQRVAWQGRAGPPEVLAQHGAPSQSFAGISVVPPPGAFLQATAAGEAAIVAAVLAALPEKLPAKARIADLYAGLGTLSLPLAGRAAVAAFEGDAAAVAALAAAAGRGGARLSATRRDLVRQPLDAKELAAFAAVVLDPPFAGAQDQMALLARAKVPRIAYVSCSMSALARDAASLAAAGYRVLAATPIDQFLWSPHLEAVVAFGRNPKHDAASA